MMQFTVPEGTVGFFANMQGGHAFYCLQGDLNQMGYMSLILRNAGFDTITRSQSGTYPGFAQNDLENYKRALAYLFKYRIHGWWNQEHAMIQHGICTREEYDAALKAQK